MNTTRSEDVTNIIKGLLEVQGALHVVKNKTATIPGRDGRTGHSYGYADLAAVWDSCRELLKAQGMVINHSTEPTTGNSAVVVTATLWHTSGQWMSASITVTPAQMTPQGVGSALTYGRRYTTAALVGIVVDDDDDGKRAGMVKADPVPTAIDAKKKTVNDLLRKLPKDSVDRKRIAEEARYLEQEHSFTAKEADRMIAELQKLVP